MVASSVSVIDGLYPNLEEVQGLRSTVKNSTSPSIFPAGFIEEYQEQLKTALDRLEVPYLDLSELFPWTGAAMIDFIHPQLDKRYLIHQVVLSWLFEPKVLRETDMAITYVPDVQISKEGVK